MKPASRKILIISLTLLAVALLGSAAWWGYRRYLSPQINPSTALYPTRGIDLSAHNGDVDFVALKNSGIDFVMLKATEGISFTDKKFHDNYNAATQAGLRVGAYHFFRFDCDGRAQASHFLTVIKDLHLDFQPVLDVEESGNPNGHEKEHIIKNLSQAIDHLKLRHYDPIIYTNKDGYRKFISVYFNNSPLWICSFTDPPGPDRWYMWQYTHRGRVDGVKGHVDINILSPSAPACHTIEEPVTDQPCDTIKI